MVTLAQYVNEILFRCRNDQGYWFSTWIPVLFDIHIRPGILLPQILTSTTERGHDRTRRG